MNAYVANVLGNGLIDGSMDVGSRPVRPSDEGIFILYGDGDGVTVAVAADDEDDAERRIIASFSDDVTIDDLQEGSDQRPLWINLLAGRVDEDIAFELLRMDAENAS